MVQERRISPRFSLQLPITLVLPREGLHVQGKTRDISASGIFLYANLAVKLDEEVELRFTLPCELSTLQVRVACRAKILRLAHDAEGALRGMAAAIQSFDSLTHPQILDDVLDQNF